MVNGIPVYTSDAGPGRHTPIANPDYKRQYQLVFVCKLIQPLLTFHSSTRFPLLIAARGILKNATSFTTTQAQVDANNEEKAAAAALAKERAEQ
jgi:hypothetical protein